MPDVDLRALLANLPAQARFAILMRYVHGYTNKVIARMLGVPEGTVKSKVHYGLEKLRKELERYE
jgi:RNA polymerase sigma-70 factor (ECF subfamily)